MAVYGNEPISKRIRVALAPDRAFELFTARMGNWWPMDLHSVGRAASVAVTFETRLDGRILERTTDGAEHLWGTVVDWDYVFGERYGKAEQG